MTSSVTWAGGYYSLPLVLSAQESLANEETKSCLEQGMKEGLWPETWFCFWHFFQTGTRPIEKVSSGHKAVLQPIPAQD